MNYEREDVDIKEYVSAKTYHLFMDKSFYMKIHFHKHIELVYLLKGSFIANIDGLRTLIQEGEILLIQPYLVHYFEMREDCEMITMLLSYEEMSHYEPHIEYKRFVISENQDIINRIKLLMVDIDSVRKSECQYKDLLVQKNVYELFYILLKEMSYETNQSIHETYQNVNQIIEYIEEHYNERISFQELSQHFGYSYAYFCRYFKKVTNQSLLQFQKRIQLKHAYIDVCNSSFNMTEISQIHGFPSVQNFMNLFKKEYQVTPYIFRKKISQK